MILNLHNLERARSTNLIMIRSIEELGVDTDSFYLGSFSFQSLHLLLRTAPLSLALSIRAPNSSALHKRKAWQQRQTTCRFVSTAFQTLPQSTERRLGQLDKLIFTGTGTPGTGNKTSSIQECDKTSSWIWKIPYTVPLANWTAAHLACRGLVSRCYDRAVSCLQSQQAMLLQSSRHIHIDPLAI